MLTVHYHRVDHDYNEPTLWTWDGTNTRQPEENELDPAGEDDFGVFFLIDPEDYGEPGEHSIVGFLPRLHKSWDYKDNGDRYWTPRLGNEIWLVSRDPRVYTERPDIAPSVRTAYLDSGELVSVHLSHGIELGRLVPSTFHVRSADGPSYPVHAVRAVEPTGGKTRMLELVLSESPPRRHELALLVDGYRAGTIERRGMDEENGRIELPLGAICSEEETIFRVFSPTALGVHVVLYDHPTGQAGRRMIPLEPTGQGIWEHSEQGDLHGRSYRLYVDAEGEAARREVVDIYTKCATGHDGHGKIIDPRRLDPQGFRPIRRPENITHPTDAIIWEAHVRDLSISSDSGVPQRHRGKYLGAAQRGTTVPNTKISTLIDHLLELGVTHVQLLPVQDFENDEISGPYNWGYMTVNFLSPEGWYASDHRSAARVSEFKELVKAFHEAGLRVVMDVVYNHTGHTSNFEAIAPGYYHRMRPDGSFWNGSGCGNEFRSESSMGRKFIVDCCKYWVEEYGVDGFRFDLMGLIDLETLEIIRNHLHAIDPTLLIYGEPWGAVPPDECGIRQVTYKPVLGGTGIGAFNDHMRDDLKGSPEGDDPGYIQNGARRDGVCRAVQGAIHDWAEDPSQVVQYAECHDNLTLWDKLAISAPDSSEETRLKMQTLGIGILAVSQGIFFLHGGMEFAREKNGNPNTYNAPDEINRIDWRRKKRFQDLFVYTKTLIAIRRAHPVFRLPGRKDVEDRMSFRDDLLPDPSAIAFVLDGTDLDGESWDETLVLINPAKEDLQFPLPEGDWQIYVQGRKCSTEPLVRASGEVSVPAHGLALLARP